jgi:outer membrane protein TolC
LLGYNSLKWDKRIEPVRFREARKNYNEALELVASQACNLFFGLAAAQANLDIAASNYASADTLYRYAEGRYNIGTITENEMLQLEINKLSGETDMMNARIEVEDQMQTLRSFLGIQDDVDIRVLPDNEVPNFQVPMAEALQMAMQNSPEPEMYERLKLQSRSNLAYAKGNAGLKADLYVQFGLSQTAETLRDSYRSPQNQQYASVGVSLPILDWGRGKGRIKVAESRLDLVETQIEQAYRDFDINIEQMVRQFNLQAQHVEVAEKRAHLAQQRYNVARQLYILGKSTILDFNSAITEKDSAHRSLLSAVQTFWSLYYGLRSMTGGKIFENYEQTKNNTHGH